MPLTKIICTLGPAVPDDAAVLDLAHAGMSVARLNLSHGSLDAHRERLRAVRALSDRERLGLAILLDTKGAEIRTGDVDEKIAVTRGQEVVFAAVPHEDTARPVIRVDYAGFAKDAAAAEQILLDNGELRFTPLEILGDGLLLARSEDDGAVGSRRHVNLPGADIALPSLTEGDWDAIRMGCEEGADFFALSFIRTAEEIEEVRRVVAEHCGHAGLITKIETRQAAENLDAIIAASDGVMVARGDLGAELPFTRIPAIQDDIVARCWAAGKPVIVATHMLESMIQHPLPTRAEVTDVAHAAVSRADATMLSGETASGKHPLRALQVMTQILGASEHTLPTHHPDPLAVPERHTANAYAAVDMAGALQAKAIILLTKSGQTARAMSTRRPRRPIIACTPDPVVQRRLQLCYGVHPLLVPFGEDPETTIAAAFAAAIQRGLLTPKDLVVLVTDVRIGGSPITTIQSRQVPEA